MVELRTVAGKSRLQIKDAFENFLHGGDVLADCRLATQLGFQVGRGTEVVRMRMGFQNPGGLQIVFTHIRNHFVRRVVSGPAGMGVVVQHRIDDGAGRARPLVHHVGHRPSGFVKNSVHLGFERIGGHSGELLN